MRIPLPKSKLVTLAALAVIGSGALAAALAAPALWNEDAPATTSSTAFQGEFAGEETWDDEDDDRWEHEYGEHEEDEDDDRRERDDDRHQRYEDD